MPKMINATTSKNLATDPSSENKTALSQLFETAANIEVKLEETKSKTIPEDQIQTVIDLVQTKANFKDKNQAVVALAITLQKGGCNSNKNTNITTTIEDASIDSKTIANFIRSNCKNASPRSFARQIGNEIFKICKKQKIVGNLKIRLEKNYPDEWKSITDPDKDYWASDFQSSTMECPDGVKFLIRKNYTELFQTQKETKK